MDELRVKEFANNMRRNILDVAYSCNVSAHIGGALSMVDILATLYGKVLNYNINDPQWEDRDRFILSKGHGALGLYAALLESRFISKEIFDSFQTNDSDLTSHPVMNIPLGIESSNGSLGQGLSMGVGIALAAKRKKKNYNVYVMLGDGECNEGAVWEAVMSAANFGLDNLFAIIDHNGYQNDGACEKVLSNVNLTGKWASFGWNTCLVDGHSIHEIYESLTSENIRNKPNAVVAKTVKGRGFSVMENNNDWHHNRVTKSIYEQAINDLEVD